MATLPHATTFKLERCVAKKSNMLSLARQGLSDAQLLAVDWTMLSHVTSLDLSGNNLTRIPLKLAEQMIQLEELTLYKNQIEEIPSGVLIYFRNLHTLLLQDNKLRALPSDFSRMAKMRVVSLSSNRFAHIPLQLAQCRALEHVEMEDNQLSESCKKQLPNLLALLQGMPAVGMFGLGGLLANSATGDLTLTFATTSGPITRLAHRHLVEREPLFRSASSLGDGQFSAAAWDAVLGFLYVGVAKTTSKAEFEEVAALVKHHKIESMLHVVEREEAQRTESGVPVEKDAVAILDDSPALGLHLQHLLTCGGGAFEIVCSDGEVVRAHEYVLEARLDHFRSMLQGKWREGSERRVEVGFDAPTVRSVLEWVYCDSIGFIYECDLVATLGAARFFAIDDLSVELQTAIADNLDSSNAQYVCELAVEEGFPTLLKLASSFCTREKIKV
jgi:hypothetical protein